MFSIPLVFTNYPCNSSEMKMKLFLASLALQVFRVEWMSELETRESSTDQITLWCGVEGCSSVQGQGIDWLSWDTHVVRNKPLSETRTATWSSSKSKSKSEKSLMNSSEYTRSVEYETRNTRWKKCVTVAVAKGVNESSPSLEETRR